MGHQAITYVGIYHRSCSVVFTSEQFYKRSSWNLWHKIENYSSKIGVSELNHKIIWVTSILWDPMTPITISKFGHHLFRYWVVLKYCKLWPPVWPTKKAWWSPSQATFSLKYPKIYFNMSCTKCGTFFSNPIIFSEENRWNHMTAVSAKLVPQQKNSILIWISRQKWCSECEYHCWMLWFM